MTDRTDGYEVVVRPRIGITTTPSSHISATLDLPRPIASLDVGYVDAVVIAGGAPVLLPTVRADRAADTTRDLDALVLSGGGDIEPSRYGAEPAPETDGVDPERDEFELAALAAAEEQGLPVLAVCRGMQLLNVARGGTLIQHVPDVTHTEHRDVEHWNVSANPVTVVADTRLHELCGGTHLTVNSLHHQAVDRVGSGLRITAVDEDDIIEAIEPTDDAPILGVQWHPELIIHEPEHEALFVWLVNQACARSDLLDAALTGRDDQ